jgi:transposase
MEIRAGKQYRTKAERRAIVEESLRPGTSVSQVARAHDVNTNQVFEWRRQYREGRLNEETNPATALLPVKITAETTQLASKPRDSKANGSGSIEIDLGHARVRIEGSADPECVRAALAGLVR